MDFVDNVHKKNITIEKKIGYGSFGDVFKAIWGQRIVAVKSIDYHDEKTKQKVDKEVKHLSTVCHENIIRLYGVSLDAQAQKTLLIMEYAENGSLYDYLHNSQRSVAYDGLLNWMLQLAKGLAYLHGREPKIMHRDVKTKNMVLTNQCLTLKICDFGLVRAVATNNTREVGTIAYQAPELASTTRYDEKCDVYSFGIVLWEVMSRKQPFEDLNALAIINLVNNELKRPDIAEVKPYKNSGHIRELIKLCWQQDPSKRPSMKGLAFILSIDPQSCPQDLILKLKYLPPADIAYYPQEKH